MMMTKAFPIGKNQNFRINNFESFTKTLNTLCTHISTFLCSRLFSYFQIIGISSFILFHRVASAKRYKFFIQYLLLLLFMFFYQPLISTTALRHTQNSTAYTSAFVSISFFATFISTVIAIYHNGRNMFFV